MKITQEVSDFAREAKCSDAVDFRKLPSRAVEEAEAGMAVMSERYREGGNELYIGAGGREHG